jgi:hypothetical protein
VDAAAQLNTLQPGEDELCSFDPAQFAQGDCKAVLARVTAQLAKHERGGDGALLDRRGETKDLVPVSADATAAAKAKAEYGDRCTALRDETVRLRLK